MKKEIRPHKKRATKWSKLLLVLSLVFITVFMAFPQNILQPEKVLAQGVSGAKISLSPQTGSFLVGSTFDVSIIVDTGDFSINTVRVNLTFPVDKIQIVKPSSGKSFVALWLEQPSYSNIDGTISFAGGIPEGLKTSSGIVATVTFRTIKAGEAYVKVLPSSSVLAHDGKGTEVLSTVIGGIYTLKPKPPQGPIVFSETHSDETVWYNNNNPIVSWERESGVTDFSFVLDSYPQTIPDNTSDGQATTKAYEDLDDGLWYFHIKAKKDGVWGGSSHFLLRIDTTPPASFKPKVEFLLAAITGRAFISFSTTDALAGINRYEVVVVDKEEAPLKAPVFIEAESPYQIPNFTSGNLRLFVRAVDNAGNVREETVESEFPKSFIVLIKENQTLSVFIILLVISAYPVFLYRRTLLRRFQKIKKEVLKIRQKEDK